MTGPRLVVVALLAGCTGSNGWCPDGWSYDEVLESKCQPPIGYAAQTYLKLGGSGAYGFVRGNPLPACTECAVELFVALELTVYHEADADLETGMIRPDAVPVTTTLTEGDGVYAVRLPPGGYWITGIDPRRDVRFYSRLCTVEDRAIARCVIQI